MRWFILSCLVIAIIAIFFYGEYVMGSTPTPSFQVVQELESVQIRQYTSITLLEAPLEGADMRAGFRQLAGYIRDNEIAMTKPVLRYEKNNQWHMAFIMPSGLSQAALPQPKNKHLTIHPVQAKKMAVIGFSGVYTQAKHQTYLQRLLTTLKTRGIAFDNNPIIALYDPPWRLPFFRHNEIWVEVE